MSEWIKVSDKKPEIRGHYLVTFKSSYPEPMVSEAFYDPDTDTWHVNVPEYTVTHWTRLPDPPEDEL